MAKVFGCRSLPFSFISTKLTKMIIMHSKEKTISSFLSFHIVSSSVSVFHSPSAQKSFQFCVKLTAIFSPKSLASPWQRPKRALMISSFVCRPMSQRWPSMSTDLGAWKDVSFEYSVHVNSLAQLIWFFIHFDLNFGGNHFEEGAIQPIRDLGEFSLEKWKYGALEWTQKRCKCIKWK